jgi:hypothetical protein
MNSWSAPPRLRRLKEASRHFLDGAATPPRLRRGAQLLKNISAFYCAVALTSLIRAALPRSSRM